MKEVIFIIINWVIPITLSSVIAFISKIYKDNKLIKKSMLALIRSEITSNCESYINKGVLPEYARYCLSELSEQYKLLGGNHGIELLVDECFKLPLK